MASAIHENNITSAEMTRDDTQHLAQSYTKDNGCARAAKLHLLLSASTAGPIATLHNL